MHQAYLNTFDFINRSFSESIFILLAHKFHFTEYAWQVSYVNAPAMWRGEGKTNLYKHLSSEQSMSRLMDLGMVRLLSVNPSVITVHSQLRRSMSHTHYWGIRSNFFTLGKSTPTETELFQKYMHWCLGESKIQDYRYEEIWKLIVLSSFYVEIVKNATSVRIGIKIQTKQLYITM